MKGSVGNKRFYAGAKKEKIAVQPSKPNADILRNKTITALGGRRADARHRQKKMNATSEIQSTLGGDKNNRRGRSGETKSEFGPFDV